MLWSSVLVLGIVQLGTCKIFLNRWDNLAVKHSWAEIPYGWEYQSPAPSDHVFELHIGLKQDRIDDLIDNLMEISDPTNLRYGQYLTKEELHSFVAPHPASVAAVNFWLQFHNIDPLVSVRRSGSGDWVTLRICVDLAEKMLGTKYNVYRHATSGQEVVRTLNYSLPEELHEYIDVISPTTYFGTPRSMTVTSFVESKLNTIVENINPVPEGTLAPNCNTTITPACLRALYNTSSYIPVSADVNKLAVSGYLEQFASYADLQTFFKKYRYDAVGSNFTTVKVNGGGDDQAKPTDEADLDIQYTTGITYPTPNIYYSTGGSPPFKPDNSTLINTNEPYLDFLNFALNQSFAQVLSTSYSDDEQTVPPAYAQRVCNMFAQLGARGTTVVFPSGDAGVGDGDCTTNDGTARVLFQPVFPSSCPYVTAVGATFHINPEVAVDFSGGGFSRLFPAPSYQTETVSKYLEGLGSKYHGLYNPTGRAYPDVSAQGKHFQVVVNGTIRSISGTSASCPTVASVFALLNDYRLSTGKKALGFINPLLYSQAFAGFTDIVSGSNSGCGTEGFTAVQGWDPVTGFGTPNFLELKKLVENL